MAMTPRIGGVRPQAKAGPIYEDFKPKIKWKHEDDPEIILIYLPGFTEERLKVTTESQNVVRIQGERLIAGNKWSQNTVKVRGERPIVGSKWSRFKEDLQIPEHCKTRGILAKFESGILTITMPRKICATQSTAPNSKAHTTQGTPTSQKAYPLPTPLSLKEKPRAMENGGKGENKEISKSNEKPTESEMCQNATRKVKNEERNENHETKGKSKMSQKATKRVEKEEGKETNETKAKVESRNYRQMVNDEREWMVSMGVAALVIVAFGVFGYYTSRSSKH